MMSTHRDDNCGKLGKQATKQYKISTAGKEKS